MSWGAHTSSRELSLATLEPEPLILRNGTTVRPLDPIEVNAGIIDERARAIDDITESLALVNELTLDLAGLVDEQRQLIDTIEDHVESAVEYTGAAATDLAAANESHRKYRNRVVKLFTGVGVFGAAAAFFLRRR